MFMILQVRLEHILERISLISDAADTEKPSSITSNLFIGGALAARSLYTLQHLLITHVLCLCSNEIGQSDSQFPDAFEYRNFSVSDLSSPLYLVIQPLPPGRPVLFCLFINIVLNLWTSFRVQHISLLLQPSIHCCMHRLISTSNARIYLIQYIRC